MLPSLVFCAHCGLVFAGEIHAARHELRCINRPWNVRRVIATLLRVLFACLLIATSVALGQLVGRAL